MARYETEILVPRPPAEVFDYLAHFENVAEWDPGIVEAERLEADAAAAVEKGSRFRVVSSFLGSRTHLDYEVVEFEPGRRVVLEGRSDSAHAVDAIDVEPAEGGCLIRWRAEVTLKRLPALADPLFGLVFRWIGNSAVAGLRNTLGTLGSRPAGGD